MRNFRRDALTTALEERRVIQGTLLRSTIHMVSAKDYWLFLSAIRKGRKDWWRRVTRKVYGEVDVELPRRSFAKSWRLARAALAT